MNEEGTGRKSLPKKGEYPMKKSLFAMLLAIALVMVPLMSLAEEAFNPEGLIDWFNEIFFDKIIGIEFVPISSGNCVLLF